MIPSRTNHAVAFLVVWLVLAGAMASAAAETTDPGKSYQYYEDALARFNGGEYRAAIVQLKNALQADSRDLAARVLLARAYLKVENGAAAEKELNFARRAGADPSFIKVSLGRAYLIQHKFKFVIEEIQSGGRGPDTEAEIHLIRGLAQLALREFEKSEAAFTAAISLDQESWEAYLGRAKVDLAQRKTGTAEGWADKAAGLAPAESEVWFVKGEISQAKRDMVRAVAYYSKSIAIQAQFLPARLRRAGILIDLGHGRRALPDIKIVREKEPENAQAAYFLALALAQTNDLKGAQAALQKAGDILKRLDRVTIFSDLPTLLLAGVVNYFQKNHDLAITQLAHYVKIVPQHAGARKILGSLLLRKGKPHEAADVLGPAVARMPRDPELIAMLADARMKSGSYREATKLYQRAVKLAPNAGAVRTGLALTRLISGDLDRAVEDLTAAVSINPKLTYASILLIVMHLKKRQFETALKLAEAAAAEDAGNPYLYDLMGGARLGMGDVAAAGRSFAKAITVAPGYEPARINLAKIKLREHDVDGARVELQNLLKRNARNMAAMVLLAEIADRERNLPEAIRWLEKARAIYGDELDLYLGLIERYFANQQADHAISLVRKLDERFPGNLRALEVLGRVALRRGKASEAKAYFERLSHKAGEQRSLEWLRKAARHQMGLEDFVGAEKSLSAALAIDDTSLPAHLAAYRLEMRTGKLEAARRRAELLRKLHPQSPAGDTLIGDVLMRKKNFAEAVEAYTRGLEKKPSSALALRVHRARRAAGQDALGFIEKWVAAHPNDRAARRRLAVGYIDFGRRNEAIRLFETLARTRPDDVGLLNNLALLYRDSNDPRSLSYAEKAYKLAPDNPGVMDTLGWVLVTRGELPRGLKLLRNAEIRAPKVPEIHFHLGVTLSRMGQKAAARREIRKALNLATDFEGAEEARAMLRKLAPQ